MYGFPLFFRLAWLAFTSSRDRIMPLTVKRFFLQCLFIPALLIATVSHAIWLFLDEIFFRGYRKVVVREPVFVVGIPRSGTTLLHRLMAEDTNRFTTFKYWELILAPSISERKCVLLLARLDGALGGIGRRLLGRFESWLLKDLQAMHPLSLFEPEEDEWLLMHRFASIFLVFPFPFMRRIRHLLYFDAEMPPRHRRNLMKFYKRCVQRHLYVHGPEKTLLSKNPSFSAKLESLNEAFPDAKIVCCVRNPHESVPSFASLMWYIWGHKPGISAGSEEMRQELLDSVSCFYRHPMACLAHLPENRQDFVLYHNLISAPKDTVTGLYHRFGLTLDAEFAAKLDLRQKKARAYTSRHSYSCEDYGLTRQDIAELYRDIFVHYGFAAE